MKIFISQNHQGLQLPNMNYYIEIIKKSHKVWLSNITQIKSKNLIENTRVKKKKIKVVLSIVSLSWNIIFFYTKYFYIFFYQPMYNCRDEASQQAYLLKIQINQNKITYMDPHVISFKWIWVYHQIGQL